MPQIVVGAIIGGLVSGVTVACRRGSFRQIAAAMVGGAVTGALAAATCGVSLGFSIAGSAMASTAEYYAEKLINGESVTTYEMIVAAVGGAEDAILGTLLGKALSARGYKAQATTSTSKVTTESASSEARKWQENEMYPGIDNWTDVTIRKGSYVWGGTPGQSNFYTTTADLVTSGNDATKIFTGLQVSKGAFDTYRPGMTMYRIPYDMDVAISQALANKHYGAGGFTQLYIPNFQDLESIQSIILINR